MLLKRKLLKRKFIIISNADITEILSNPDIISNPDSISNNDITSDENATSQEPDKGIIPKKK